MARVQGKVRPPEATGPVPGPGSIRMLDIARSLGVSRSTVSLVMRGSSLVADSTRDAVLAEAERLGYVYNTAAATLRTARTTVVGLVMPDILNPFIAEFTVGVQEGLSEHDLFVVVADTRDQRDAQRAILRSFAEARAAGILLIPALDSTTDDLAVLRLGSLRTVLVTRDIPGADLPFESVDEPRIGRLAASHLADVHGCRRIGYFGGEQHALPRRIRLTAVRRVLRRTGAALADGWSDPFPATIEAAYARARELVATGDVPQGLLCHSDNVAYGTLRALSEAGVGPDQCAVVGVDDLRQSRVTIPALTSVSTQPHEVGRAAARRLLLTLGLAAGAEQRPPAPQLHVRESCGCRPD